ncbi:MAG: DUF3306 domain-containing protein [Limnohabitans sp.]|nr:DUF3306 domain-containing protein [Limnohabitans sp.]
MANDPFLSRWSRRKQAVLKGLPIAEPTKEESIKVDSTKPLASPTLQNQAPLGASFSNAQVQETDSTPVPTLDDVNKLTQESDYSAFMSSKVSPDVKNAAMKKLFSDPHFNVMDRMDTYIDDYNTPDPLPLSMLKQMASAKFLNLFEEEPEKTADPNQASNLPIKHPLSSGNGVGADTSASEVVAQSPTEPVFLTPTASTAQEPLLDHSDLRLQPNTPSELPGIERKSE